MASSGIRLGKSVRKQLVWSLTDF